MIKKTLSVTLLFCSFLFCSLAALAQRTAAPPPAPGTAPGFALPGGFTPPEGLLDQFWRDPEIARELRLSDAQKSRLEDAALSQRLSLIDAGADALKALAHVDALLKAEQLDEAAYKQQIDNLSAAVAHAIQDLGDMAMTPRRVLTPEQWTKLRSLRLAHRPAPPAHPGAAPVPKP